jgi:hypothetical protein
LHLDKSIIEDAVRFVPELAPLAAAAIDSRPSEHRRGAVVAIARAIQWPVALAMGRVSLMAIRGLKAR